LQCRLKQNAWKMISLDYCIFYKINFFSLFLNEFANCYWLFYVTFLPVRDNKESPENTLPFLLLFAKNREKNNPSFWVFSHAWELSKGGRSANNFHKFADLNGLLDCGHSANVTLCRFSICRPKLADIKLPQVRKYILVILAYVTNMFLFKICTW